MPGGIGSRTLGPTQPTTSAAPILPEGAAATSIAAEKALHVAATMLNNLLSTAVASTSFTRNNSGIQTTPTTTSESTPTLTSSILDETTTSIHPTPPVPEQHAGVFIYGFCLVLIPTATILGNLLVIISVLRFKALHSAINFLILGLAVADLLVALCVMPFAVYVYVQGGFWFLGPLMCDIYSAIDVACSTASILLLAVISFDRYRAVSRPIHYSRQAQNIRRVIMILIIIWIISILLASPMVLGVNHRPPEASPYECRFYNPEFSIGSSVVSFIIPCCIVLFVYLKIMIALRKREKAAKMRRLANQQETKKAGGDLSAEENDAGNIVSAPGSYCLMRRVFINALFEAKQLLHSKKLSFKIFCTNHSFALTQSDLQCYTKIPIFSNLNSSLALIFAADSDDALSAEELCSLLPVAINVLMLALPTIQKRMRRFERHQKAVFEAGELFNRASFARTLFMPRAVGLLSAQSYLLSSVVSSTPPTQSNLDHNQLTSPKTNNKSPRLSPIPSPLFAKNETARRKSLALTPSPSPRKQQRRPSQALNPSMISSAAHALSSACVSAVAAVSVLESPNNNEPTPQRRCRFSSFAETKEYDVDSEDDKRSQIVDEVEDETEDGDEDEESGSDEFFDDEDISSDDRSNNFSTAKQLFSKVGTGIQNAAAAISSKHRLSLAEPNIRGFKPAVRKLGMNQASSARNSFLGQSTPQALGISSLMPLLASHESFRRCSDSVSQTVRSNSTAGMETRQTLLTSLEKPDKLQNNNSRPFSTSPTVRPETWQTLTPRTSPAIFTSPTHSASLMPHRESDTARSTISTTNNSYLSFSTCPSVNSLSVSARSSINNSILNEELVLNVENFKTQEVKQQKTDEVLASILSPTETTTTTIPAEPITPLASPSKSPTNIQEDHQLNLERQSSIMRRSFNNREKIWELRSKFFRTEIHSKSPLMLRRFVLDVENDPITQDEHDVCGNSSSPLSSSDSLSDNLNVVTNDFVSEAPTSMSRKSSEFDSSDLKHSPPTRPVNNINSNRLFVTKEKSPKQQDSMIRNSVKRFKSFHVNHRAIQLPNVDVSKATAELLRHFSRKSPRLFRPSASPSSTNSVPVVSQSNNVEKMAIRKKLSYTGGGDTKISRPYGIARRKSESYTSSVRIKARSNFRFSDVGSVKILSNHQKKPSPIQEIGIPLISNSNNEPLPPRKASKRYPGTLTSSTLCEELDYVDLDSINENSQLSRLNSVGDRDSQGGRQRSPIPYSEETTSSATDVNLTSPIQSVAVPIVPQSNDNFYKSESDNVDQPKARGSLVIENQTATEVRTIPKSNGKPSNREDANSPSVTFKIPGKEVKPFRRLSSAVDVLESSKLLEKPPIPISQSTNSVTVSPKHSKSHKRSFSQKVSSASMGKGEPSVESCYSSSQSQATTGVYASTPTPTKNLESKLKMVKRAINRKESSLKRKVNKAQRKEKRATKTLGIVVGIFLLCWVPFFTLNILNAVCILFETQWCEVGFSPFFYSTWLGYTNSFINPIIYGIFNTEFRRAFRSLLIGRTNGRRRARHV